MIVLWRLRHEDAVIKNVKFFNTGFSLFFRMTKESSGAAGWLLLFE
jgi:hypothetical protein